MFLKLWKYEMKCSYRAFFLMYVILLLPTLLMNTSIGVISALSSILYACMIIVILVMTFVMIIRTYNKSMFSNEAYLTLTLPVSGKTLMAVKILNASLWFLLSYVMIFVSVLIIGFRFNGITLSDLSMLMSVISREMSFDALLTLFNLMVSMVQMVAMIYMIMNFTHTNWIRRHRGLIGVAIFVVLNIIISYISGLIFVDGSYNSMMNLFISTNETSVGLIENSLVFSTIESVVLLIVCFFGASYILDHKLEIE